MKTYLEPAEIQSIINTADNLRDRLILRLLFHLGCRVSELTGIKTSEIDYKNHHILIQHLKFGTKKQCTACSAKVGKSQHYCPKCGGDITNAPLMGQEIRKRLLPVDTETLGMIKKYVTHRKKKSDKLIPLTRFSIYSIVRWAAEDAGLGGKVLIHPETGKEHYISPHKFRDAFATHAIKRVPDIEGQVALQHHLGHRSFNTTVRYVRQSDQYTKDWYDKIWKEPGVPSENKG